MNEKKPVPKNGDFENFLIRQENFTNQKERKIKIEKY